MKFDPIDWKKYNKPPYFPQYLTRGETLKLVTYDDKLLADVDTQIRKMSDQYDIEKAKGILLDRIGKKLSEPRDGNDDELYRLLIRLRIMLNTTDGTINDIIKVIKTIFSSEMVHIAPNYPAGITILHDGEGPSIDFNRIISQVVGAGIAYDTKELFYFEEKVFFTEAKPNIVVRRNVTEEFFGRIRHNGRILRDGHTIRDTEVHTFYRNGKHDRDGTLLHQKKFITPAMSYIKLPLRHWSGPEEQFSLNIGTANYVENYHGRLVHNGSVNRDGQVRHDMVSPSSASEIVSPFMLNMAVAEYMPSHEESSIAVIKDMTDTWWKDLRHNGTIRRNGKSYRTGAVVDKIKMQFAITGFEDRAAGTLLHNGSIKRDGTEYRARRGKYIAYDALTVGIRKHHFHDAVYKRDGSICHDSMILIPV